MDVVVSLIILMGHRRERLTERYESWTLGLGRILGPVVRWFGPRRGRLIALLRELDGERVSLRLFRNASGTRGRLDTRDLDNGSVTLRVEGGIVLRQERDRLVLLSDIRYVEHDGRRWGPF